MSFFAILTFSLFRRCIARSEGITGAFAFSPKTAQSQRSTPITVTLDQEGRIATG